MNTLSDPVVQACQVDGNIVLRFAGGEERRFPIRDNRRLAHASEADLNRSEISPFGIHWPTLDEDPSIRGIIEGNYGQRE